MKWRDAKKDRGSRENRERAPIEALPEPPPFDNAAERLGWLRMKYGMTLEEFGQHMGYHGSHISRIEKGVLRPVRKFALILADAFGVNEEWLLEGKGPAFQQNAAQWMGATAEAAPPGKPAPALSEKDAEIVQTLLSTVHYVAGLSPIGRRLAAPALHEMVDELCRPQMMTGVEANEEDDEDSGFLR